MMRQYELVERVQKYDPAADEALLNRAYVYAMQAHGDQTRASGAPYFSHPLEVAAILTELKLDDATIATALLHDVIEDTSSTRAEIERLFGSEIGDLVYGLTKLRRLDLVSKKAEQAENFRKLLLAISNDIRVLMVKLADRLHNMRTLEHVSEARRRRISQETLDIYAPLAGRMGMQAIRDELETLAFQWIHPTAYATVTDRLAKLQSQNRNLVEDIRAVLQDKLGTAGIDADVAWREKRPYSVWRKMENRQISLEQLSDLYGFRVIVNDIEACYRVLGLAHTTWQTVPGRFKDYVSAPKRNNYQSIHTTIIGPGRQRLELQIRTHDMHRVAEYGIAAHALYKDIANEVAPTGTQRGKNGQAPGAKVRPASDSGPYAWLRSVVDTLMDGSDPEEFLENTKLELFQDQVFCFSPKGRLIALPRNATPLDFAYAVHTDIGNAAIGAVINGRQQPINTRLRNGDQVEIITREGHVPPIAWEGFAVTGRARSAVRRAARNAVRGQYAEIGRRFMKAAAERNKLGFDEDKLGRVLPRLGVSHTTTEDVLAAVGRNELGTTDVLKALYPEARLVAVPGDHRPKNRHHATANQEGWFNLERGMGLRFRLTDSILDMWKDAGSSGTDEGREAPGSEALHGTKGEMPISFPERAAVPGDRIVGVMSPGEGIRIFQIHSPQLQSFENEQWIDVAWDIDPDKPQRFPATLKIIALNEPGSLAEIARSISDQDGNIDEVKMLHRGVDFTELLIVVEVWDVSHLNHIMTALNDQPVVSESERMFD